MTHRGLLLANARVVLAERVIEAGWVAAANGLIVEIGEGRAPGHAEDLAGDLLLPGLVELHTDHLEAHYVPRPKVRTGIRSRPWFPTTASSRPAASRPCSIHCEFGARSRWKTSTGRRRSSPRP